ncbi:peroxiredoxin-like protein [Alkaliphilus metalliredigens QYMF]|uniref:Peroxiredoxin-like protein n=3 Tax=Alkaliphilus TaxID=114627 RepID=A6TN93_ALKMQ|nr:peroxiredoxin-like protein [Alkaliphilus metalliredigens QYMF]
MTEEIKAGCVRPELMAKPEENVHETVKTEKKEEEQNMIRVGKPAPLFTAPAFHEGKFVNVSLEDYKGKWVLLCFYPGDFTFV